MGRRANKRGGPFSRKFLLFIFFAAAAFAVFLYRDDVFGPGRGRAPQDKAIRLDVTEQETPSLPKTGTVKEPPAVTVVKPSRKAAVVIDDMGEDMAQITRLLKLDTPVTVAILPFRAHSKDVANFAHEGGLEVLLHIPMEPKNLAENDPGKGALLVNMGIKDIRSVLNADMDEIPYITGVNNHMGSRFTEDASLMKEVLAEVKQRGFFFLDSKTTDKSKVLSVAKKAGVKSVGRDVFLDNEQDKEYIKGQFRELIGIAKKRGKAIAIGHPHAATLTALEEMIPEFEREGVEIVRVGELLE